MSAQSRDINESDTGLIVTDILHDMFGYEKYSEITSEYKIRSTYCDLAIKLDGDLALLIEVKSIGIDLKAQHTKQAIDYAANQGVDWVVLTNGMDWKVYRITFKKPIQSEVVLSFSIDALSPRSQADLEVLGLLAKEGWSKAHLGEYHSQRQALSRFAVGALLVGDPVLAVVRRELRRVSPDVRVSQDDVEQVLREEVIKREVLEGDSATAIRRKISRAVQRNLRKRKSSGTDAEPEPTKDQTSLHRPRWPDRVGQPKFLRFIEF